MSRRKKLQYNSAAGVLNQLITLICGFVLPAAMIRCYGSDVNGLVSSITEFLALIALMECGVGAVVRAALYKPLADKDNVSIGRIYYASNRFFRGVAAVFIVYVGILLLVFPEIDANGFGLLYDGSLIVIIAVAQFAQYFFGITNQLLLSADQKVYVTSILHMVALALSTIVCCMLMFNGYSIQVVKAAGTFFLLVRPFVMSLYVSRHYRFNKKEHYESDPLKQKWNALAQHISSVVLNSTDVVILTLFTDFATVSVYSVYNLVVKGMKQLVDSLTSGVQSLMGDLFARDEIKTLNEFFDGFESLMHLIVIVVFTCTGLLIVPFVLLCVGDVQDVNYDAPLFAAILVVAQAVYLLRLPYSVLVLSIGHFRETQGSAIVEASINIIVSIVLVLNYGLAGVAAGTFAAMVYRTCYFVYYVKNNVLMRSPLMFLKHVAIDLVAVAVSVFICLTFVSYLPSDFVQWGIAALETLFIVATTTCLISLIAFPETTRALRQKFFGGRSRNAPFRKR